MAFIPINKANGLSVGKEVFTLNDKGEHGIGILRSKTEDASGVKHVFEVPQYFNPGQPAIKPVLAENITHIEKYKNKSDVDTKTVVQS